MKYAQIPIYNCSGDTELLTLALKSIDTKKYSTVVDGGIITIKEVDKK